MAKNPKGRGKKPSKSSKKQPGKEQLKAFDRLKEIDPDALVEWNDRTGFPKRLKGKLSAPLKAASAQVIEEYAVPVAAGLIVGEAITELSYAGIHILTNVY